MFQSPGPLLFQIGSFGLHWYGLLIGLGIFAAILYAIRALKRLGQKTEMLYDIGFWIVLCGVIGARIYYVIFQWETYASNPLEIFQIWRGGLAIHGALLGGFLAFFAYASIKKLNRLFYLDVLAPGIILAQAVGRWGNFFNNEAFGRPTDSPLKLFIPPEFRPQGFENYDYFHPTFLYESLWNLLGFFLLAAIFRKLYPREEKSQKSGFVFFGYLMFYSFGRFFIESLRLDSLMLGSLRVAQIAGVLIFFIGLGCILYLKNKGK